MSEIKYLEHYSPIKLEIIDPYFYGTGPINGYERIRKERIPRSYYYIKDTIPENDIKNNAKFKYIIKSPDKIIDLVSKEAESFFNMTTDLYGNTNYNELENIIKKKGYNGFINSNSSLPKVVSLFYPQKPIGFICTSNNNNIILFSFFFLFFFFLCFIILNGK
jgi:hypothetical protein